MVFADQYDDASTILSGGTPRHCMVTGECNLELLESMLTPSLITIHREAQLDQGHWHASHHACFVTYIVDLLCHIRFTPYAFNFDQSSCTQLSTIIIFEDIH